VASDEKISPNKKTLTYSNIGAYMQRGITLVGGPVKVLHKGCIKQILCGYIFYLDVPAGNAGVLSLYIYIYIYM